MFFCFRNQLLCIGNFYTAYIFNCVPRFQTCQFGRRTFGDLTNNNFVTRNCDSDKSEHKRKYQNSKQKIHDYSCYPNQKSLPPGFCKKSAVCICNFFVFANRDSARPRFVLPIKSYETSNRKPVNGIKCLAKFAAPSARRKTNTKFFDFYVKKLCYKKMTRFVD